MPSSWKCYRFVKIIEKSKEEISLNLSVMCRRMLEEEKKHHQGNCMEKRD